MGIKIEFESALDVQDFCQRFAKPTVPEVVTIEKEVYMLKPEKMRALILEFGLDTKFRNEKIKLIKLIRTLTGLGLKEAKEMSDSLYGI